MKTTLIALFLAAATSTAAYAQAPPVGGPDAKGNSPIKSAHTVNDGSAKPAANSFTQAQAMRHIEKSGFTNVSGLVKGRDGVWRGTAMKNGAPVNVAMDFKGNVTEAAGSVTPARHPSPARSAPVRSAPARSAGPATSMETTGPAASSDTASAPTATDETSDASRPARHRMHERRRHRHHRHAAACSRDPGPNGVACSGRDRNRNGVSDKEDRAMSHGARP